MSNQAITWAYRQKVPRPGAKFVLVTLANYADGEGFCYPGQVRLARLTSISERAVRAHLAYLENALGLIKREHRRGPRGKWTSDGYQLRATPEELHASGADGRQNLLPAKSSAGKNRPAAKSAANTKGNNDGPSVISSARPSASQDGRTVKDPRATHPAVRAVKALMSRFPEKVLWDDLISLLGEEPDLERLTECRKAWIKSGFNPNSLVWVLEWYAHGVPERTGNSNAGNGRDLLPEKRCSDNESSPVI